MLCIIRQPINVALAIIFMIDEYTVIYCRIVYYKIMVAICY